MTGQNSVISIIPAYNTIVIPYFTGYLLNVLLCAHNFDTKITVNQKHSLHFFSTRHVYFGFKLISEANWNYHNS